jgi:signal transduction histidine kinase
MEPYRQALRLGIPLIAGCLLLIGFLTSRQIQSLVTGELEFQQRVRESRQTQGLVILSLVLTAIAGAIVTVRVRSEVQRRALSEDAMRAALQQVDERVRQRTTELSQANEHLKVALAARDEALGREQQARATAERANRLKDQFLATVSHELRTPLNAIVGWACVLKTGSVKPAETAQAIEAIERNAHAQTALIAQLLDVSRMMQGHFALAKARTDIRRAVDAAVDAAGPQLKTKALTIAYARPTSELPVMGDDERLQQLASHLLSNAVKFTPQGGHIGVTLREDARVAELSVRDTGEGIDAELLPHLFEPFSQGRTREMRRGLGLGLALVKELVDRHGGTVTAHSEGFGKGSAFTVRIPLAIDPAIKPATEPTQQPI